VRNDAGMNPSDIFRLMQIVCALAERRACSISDVIDQLEMGSDDIPPSPDPVDFARTAKHFRSSREPTFGAPLFRDPAWDMLLDLLISDADDRRVSISSLCLGSGVPVTTALRHLDRLAQHSFIVRHDDERDHRRSYVEFAQGRKDQLLQFLAEWAREGRLPYRKPSARVVASTPGYRQCQRISAASHPVFLS